ncbi:hypothetical protein J3458_004384 [Metarhizium acridum]|uniref:uncharacterized protein n=1 Tax=Metarhizium acridum TaxID=92637 RepID=UPI001C6CD342|nr:hypothetical protein J3458_004384 [Metarhizium acridum]
MLHFDSNRRTPSPAPTPGLLLSADSFSSCSWNVDGGSTSPSHLTPDNSPRGHFDLANQHLSEFIIAQLVAYEAKPENVCSLNRQLYLIVSSRSIDKAKKSLY